MAKDDDKHLTFVLSYVITVVWVVSFVIEVLDPNYSPPPSVHALMLLVAGALFGKGVIDRDRRE